MSETELQGAREDVAEPPAARPPLGPGEDDPKSIARGHAGEASKPPGPGDDSASVDRGTPAASGPPPGPGDGPESDFEMAAPPPPGPGSIDAGPRRATLIPKKKAAPVADAAPAPVESSTRRSRRTT